MADFAATGSCVFEWDEQNNVWVPTQACSDGSRCPDPRTLPDPIDPSEWKIVIPCGGRGVSHLPFLLDSAGEPILDGNGKATFDPKANVLFSEKSPA